MLAKSGKFKLSSLFSGRPAGSNTLRMTAMIDVIFLLLIFFLLTAKFRPAEDFLPVDVPAQRASSPLAVEPLEIFIDQPGNDCTVSMAGSQFLLDDLQSPQNLRNFIQDALNSQSRYLSDPVEIICSDDVSWQNLVIIYDTLYGAGLADISFRLEN